MEYVLYIFAGVALATLAWLVWHNLWSFSAQAPDDYAGQGPEFDIRTHLSGPIQCEGVIYGPTGRVASRFVADMEATWDGETCTLTEAFRYDNGSTQDRCWTLTLDSQGRIQATAPDLIGAGAGSQKGPGVQLKYRIQLPKTSGGHVLDVTDWMYLIENGSIINRSQFRKFGIQVAELVATMRPKPIAAPMGEQQVA
ncbi:MAG: DUF3833 domain-containing protein [Pseudomonadota bacterium]